MYYCFFFFSSRRRHTRCYRDWSSDVCSSDLLKTVARFVGRGTATVLSEAKPLPPPEPPSFASATVGCCRPKIGRASCRERVEIWVVEGVVKRKKKESGGVGKQVG